ncbi:hypothetical protein SLA2020_186930 [Shorea laevis]
MEFISKSICIGVNGEPYTIKVMEEEAINGIFSMKSDHVFKELSGFDDVSSESWSLNNGLDDELSEAFVDGAVAKNSRTTIIRSRDDDDDVDEVAETPQVAETSEENPHNRWEQARQISKTVHSLAVNDRPANVVEFRDHLHATRDDKIQGLSNSNHEGSSVGMEWVPGCIDQQKIQIFEGHSLNEISGPLKVRSPTKQNGSWANNSPRPMKEVTIVMGDCNSSKEETDGSAGSFGPTNHHTKKKAAIKRSSPQKTCEIVKDKAAVTVTHSVEHEAAFWRGFESESGCEQEWMGRRQRKPKRNKRRKSDLVPRFTRKWDRRNRSVNWTREGEQQRSKEQRRGYLYFLQVSIIRWQGNQSRTAESKPEMGVCAETQSTVLQRGSGRSQRKLVWVTGATKQRLFKD